MQTDTDPKLLPNIPGRFSARNTFLELFNDKKKIYLALEHSSCYMTQGMLNYFWRHCQLLPGVMGIEWFNETVFTALFGNLSPAESDVCVGSYRGAGKSLARPGRKQARKHVRERAISTTSRRELSSRFFFSCKARRRRKFTPFWQKH